MIIDFFIRVIKNCEKNLFKFPSCNLLNFKGCSLIKLNLFEWGRFILLNQLNLVWFETELGILFKTWFYPNK